MPKLYHFPLCPFSRRIRLALGEFGLDAELAAELPGVPTPALVALNPSGDLPVFVEDDGTAICGVDAVANYLDETRGVPLGRSLFGRDEKYRAEVRRLVAWFDGRFNREVTEYVIGEKVIGRQRAASRPGGPNMARVRAGLNNIRGHLEVIGGLADRRNWLAGATLSQADLAAAAHLSCIDFLGDVPWSANESAKNWYARIKSRPSFRPLLADYISGISPPRGYADLDF